MSALFSANTNLQVRTLFATLFDSHFDELADALDIQYLERIVLKNFRFVVHRQELVLSIFT